jgi:oxaloacetate decarboxylase gamma subunit
MREMLIEGVELMFSGMLIVFLFLALLVYAVGVLRKVVERYFPEPEMLVEFVRKSAAEVPPHIVTAISIAVKQYREKYQNK